MSRRGASTACKRRRSRRILCVTSNFPRWADDSTTPFVLHLAQDLQSLGWEIDVLAPHALGAAVIETIEGVRVERFRYLWPQRLESVCYQGGALINLHKRRSEALKLPCLVAAEWWATMRRLAAGDYALLHTHWLLPQGFVGVSSAGLMRIPHVVTVHGGDIFSLQGRLLRQFKRATVRGADRVTVNSSVTEQAVMALDPGSTPVVRIPMGVALNPPGRDAAEVRRQRSLYRRGSGPLLVFVGRLVQDKGVADLLAAIRLLAQPCPDLTALVIGEGQDRSALQQQARTLGVHDRVHFTGWTQNRDATILVAAADIFINPSRQASNGWVEAQGLAILEAMAAGTPVIATALGGVIDAVMHEHTGLLVDHQAPEQIAAAVLRLNREAGLAQRLSRRAKALVRASFARETSAAAFSGLFLELIGEPSMAGPVA